MIKSATVAFALLVSFASLSFGQTFSIDPIHSSVIFKVMHADTANFFGRFNKVAGSVNLDAGALTSLTLTVDANSVDTNSKQRDEHLRNPDFFNTKEFPEITFKSTGVKMLEDKKYEVAGELTLHGQTKPVTVTLTQTGAGKNMQGKDTVGYETTFTIKRSEYGMSGYIDKGIGDDVTLMVSFEANNK